MEAGRHSSEHSGPQPVTKRRKAELGYPWSHRYKRWQQEQHKDEPGLGIALLQLSLSSLLHPRLGADAPELTADVVEMIGTALLRAFGFCGILKGHTREVFACLWNPELPLLASGSGDSSGRIWNLESAVSESKRSIVLEHSKKADDGSSDISSLDWNRDGTKLATACCDGTVKVWSKEGKLITTLTGHEGPVLSVKWNPRSDLLLSCSVDTTAIVWCASIPLQVALAPC